MASPYSFPRPAPAPAIASGNTYPRTPTTTTPAAPYQSDQTYDPGRILKSGYDWVSNKLSGLGDALTPDPINLAPVQQAQQRAYGLEDQLAGERGAYRGNYSPVNDARLAAEQQGNISDLAMAAAGATPSPAEIQLQKQAGLNAARQFGLASALQGRNPGAALRSARLGSIATQAATNVDAAALRAQEQAQARNALVQALQAARGQGQQLLANDTDWRRALLSGELGGLESGTRAATGEVDAQARQAAANNSFLGGLVSTGGQILGSIFSDRTVKTDIRPRDMSKLATAIKGYSFRYKDQGHGEGERVGVMAQDVAKGGKAGKLIVRRGPDRKLRLDAGNAIGAALAMSAQALREARKAA